MSLLWMASVKIKDLHRAWRGLQAGHEPALRVLRRQHAPEELRVRHGPAGQLGHQGLLEPRELRRRRLVGLQAEGQPPGVLSVVRRGVPQDPNPTALPHRRSSVLRAHGEELAALRVGQEVSELDRHAWLAAHAPVFYFAEKKCRPPNAPSSRCRESASAPPRAWSASSWSFGSCPVPGLVPYSTTVQMNQAIADALVPSAGRRNRGSPRGFLRFHSNGRRDHGGAGALRDGGPAGRSHRGGAGIRHAEQRPELERRADLQPACSGPATSCGTSRWPGP